MDSFYQTDNRALSELVEKLKPIFEQLPERKDIKYQTLDSDCLVNLKRTFAWMIYRAYHRQSGKLDTEK